MNLFKKSFIILIFLCFFSLNSFYSSAVNIQDISGESAILIDANSGEVLFEKNIHKKIYPASTTKILTAILAIENLSQDMEITVPDNFEYVDGSSLYLMPGEKFTVRELLEAMLIHSCNDVSILFAQEISGDIVSFADLMNDKAKELGCTRSNFVNPHGLHDENHYTTAYDMAIISRAAMNNSDFRKIVSTAFLEMKATPQYGEKRYLQNTNRFLWSDSQIIYNNEYIPIKYDIVNGIKTGYTEEAGNCLMSSAQKDDLKLICGVFKANGFEVYRDSRILLDYGFDNFKTTNLIKQGEVLGEIEIKRTIQKNLKYGISSDFYIISDRTSNPQLKWEFIPDNISLPVNKGDVIGKINIEYENGKYQKTYDAIALNDLESIFTFKNFKNFVLEKKDSILSLKTFFAIVVFFIFLLILRLIYIQIKRRNRRKRYKGL